MAPQPVFQKILIVNTRTGGENPNILCAVSNNQSFIPQLAVYDHPPNLPPNCLWNIVYDNPGAQFRIEIDDQFGNTFCLGVPHDAKSGTPCSLVRIGDAGYCTAWAFPFGTRLLSGLGSGLHPYDGTQGTLSLDAGKYPVPIVWEFVSNANQTWQFGPSMDKLQQMPY